MKICLRHVCLPLCRWPVSTYTAHLQLPVPPWHVKSRFLVWISSVVDNDLTEVQSGRFTSWCYCILACMTMIGSNITIFDMVSNMGKFVDNNFLSRTQLVAIDLRTAGCFDPEVFVNCVQDKEWGDRISATMSLYSIMFNQIHSTRVQHCQWMPICTLGIPNVPMLFLDSIYGMSQCLVHCSCVHPVPLYHWEGRGPDGMSHHVPCSVPNPMCPSRPVVPFGGDGNG